MDEQFDRIENMMFVRTRYIQPDGEIEVEEDGCDQILDIYYTAK